MRTFVVFVLSFAALLGLAAAGKDMPDFPCTFSTKLVENAEYDDSVSLKDRIMTTLMFSHSPQRRLEAEEALAKLKKGETVSGFQKTVHDEAFWYMIEDQYETLIMDRNYSIFWQASRGALTQLVPYFDRFICAKFLSPDIPILCPRPALQAEMKFLEIRACPNHPGKQCDVYEGKYESYTQQVLMVKNTNILDTVTLNSPEYTYRGDYVGLDTSKPDPSHFVPPTKYPCSDYTTVPSSSSASTWSAKKYPGKKFQLNPLSKTLFRQTPPRQKLPPAPQTLSRISIPDHFDAREQWPECSTMKEIRDQGSCGSCWAFGAAESFGDRYCVATGKSITFSPQFLVDCYDDSDGCNGGNPDLAWYDLISKGVVPDQCKPYSAQDEKCTDTCDDQSPMVKYYAKSAYSPYAAFDINKTVRLIQEEIIKNGPVEAAFFVFTEFMDYSGGVYQRQSTSLDGGHAIKIIGWGVDEATKVPYWLVANSWGEDWGEKGFFRIRRGTNECDIESQVATGLIKH